MNKTPLFLLSKRNTASTQNTLVSHVRTQWHFTWKIVQGQIWILIFWQLSEFLLPSYELYSWKGYWYQSYLYFIPHITAIRTDEASITILQKFESGQYRVWDKSGRILFIAGQRVNSCYKGLWVWNYFPPESTSSVLPSSLLYKRNFLHVRS